MAHAQKVVSVEIESANGTMVDFTPYIKGISEIHIAHEEATIFTLPAFGGSFEFSLSGNAARLFSFLFSVKPLGWVRNFVSRAIWWN